MKKLKFKRLTPTPLGADPALIDYGQLGPVLQIV